jgi:hypothetical protein
MNSLERDWVLTVLLLGGLATLLVFAAMELGGSLPNLAASNRRSTTVKPSIPVSAIDALFAATVPGQLAPPAKTLNPFYTTYYQPPPTKPPTTRKVVLTYQGYLETTAGRSGRKLSPTCL